jgi:serine/threonine-protein kinase RIO1
MAASRPVLSGREKQTLNVAKCADEFDDAQNCLVYHTKPSKHLILFQATKELTSGEERTRNRRKNEREIEFDWFIWAKSEITRIKNDFSAGIVRTF